MKNLRNRWLLEQSKCKNNENKNKKGAHCVNMKP